MIASWIFGLWLLVLTGGFASGWLHSKLLLVILLSVMHLVMARWCKHFERDENSKSAKFFRFANEVPTLLMIGIVIMVIVKPF